MTPQVDSHEDFTRLACVVAQHVLTDFDDGVLYVRRPGVGATTLETDNWTLQIDRPHDDLSLVARIYFKARHGLDWEANLQLTKTRKWSDPCICSAPPDGTYEEEDNVPDDITADYDIWRAKLDAATAAANNLTASERQLLVEMQSFSNDCRANGIHVPFSLTDALRNAVKVGPMPEPEDSPAYAP